MLDQLGTDSPFNRFIKGCSRMRGEAKSIDITRLLSENRWMMKRLASMDRRLPAVGLDAEARRRAPRPVVAPVAQVLEGAPPALRWQHASHPRSRAAGLLARGTEPDRFLCA